MKLGKSLLRGFKSRLPHHSFSMKHFNLAAESNLPLREKTAEYFQCRSTDNRSKTRLWSNLGDFSPAY